MRVIEAVDPSLLPAAGDTAEQLAHKHRQAQMVVYLAQSIGGIDLGYRFGWRPGWTGEGIKGAFDRELVEDMQKAVSLLGSIESRLTARLKKGAGPELSPQERRLTSDALTNHNEGFWRIQGALERMKRALGKDNKR